MLDLLSLTPFILLSGFLFEVLIEIIFSLKPIYLTDILYSPVVISLKNLPFESVIVPSTILFDLDFKRVTVLEILVIFYLLMI